MKRDNRRQVPARRASECNNVNGWQLEAAAAEPEVSERLRHFVENAEKFGAEPDELGPLQAVLPADQ